MFGCISRRFVASQDLIYAKSGTIHCMYLSRFSRCRFQSTSLDQRLNARRHVYSLCVHRLCVSLYLYELSQMALSYNLIGYRLRTILFAEIVVALNSAFPVSIKHCMHTQVQSSSNRDKEERNRIFRKNEAQSVGFFGTRILNYNTR